MSDKVYIYTDGACSGNPGPGGWAALLRYKTKEKLISGSEPHTTNNRMELLAAIEGLKALTRRSEVYLVTDSQYLQQGMTKWIANWRKKGILDGSNSSSKIKNIDLWQMLEQLNKTHSIHWQWVRGHSGHVENEIVDKAARDEVDKIK